MFFFSSLCSDPYLNTDAGTMSPFEHGEVYVLDDGGEVSTFFESFDVDLRRLAYIPI